MEEIGLGKNKLCCDCGMLHEASIERVQSEMVKEEEYVKLSELFKVFADDTRIKILWALDKSELCVCDIAVLLDMTKSAVSHQLRVLKESRLVIARRQGKVIYYSFADSHVKDIFEKAVEHINE